MINFFIAFLVALIPFACNYYLYAKCIGFCNYSVIRDLVFFVCFAPNAARSIAESIYINSSSYSNSINLQIYSIIWILCWVVSTIVIVLLLRQSLKFRLFFLPFAPANHGFLARLQISIAMISIEKKILAFFAISFLSLLVLVILSPVGLAWILNPRDAYILGRSGLGLFWIMMYSSSLFCCLFILLSNTYSKYKTFFILLPPVAIIYFTGSKGAFTCFFVMILIRLFNNFSLFSYSSISRIVVRALRFKLEYFFGLLPVVILVLIYFYSSSLSSSQISVYDYLLDVKIIDRMIVLANHSVGYSNEAIGSHSLTIFLSSFRIPFCAIFFPENCSISSVYSFFIDSDYQFYNTPSLNPLLLTIIDWPSEYFFLGSFVYSLFNLMVYIPFYMFCRSLRSSSVIYPKLIPFLGIVPLLNPLISFNLLILFLLGHHEKSTAMRT